MARIGKVGQFYGESVYPKGEKKMDLLMFFGSLIVLLLMSLGTIVEMIMDIVNWFRDQLR